MSNLANLADDVWQLLLSLDGLSLCLPALLTVGNKALHGRITRNFSSFRLILQDKGATLDKWARLLHHLTALESVEIRVTRIAELPQTVVSELIKLPPTLQSLVIQAPEATEFAFLQSTTSDSPEVFWLAQAFPLLRTLILKDSARLPRPKLLDVTELQGLNHLRELDCLFELEYPPNEGFSALPRTLTSLSLPTSKLSNHAASTLPPTLTHFTGPEVTSEEGLMALPRSIITGNYFYSTSLDRLIALALPPNVQELPNMQITPDFLRNNAVWAGLLPSTLTSLTWDDDITVDQIALLPRSLRKLKLRCIDSRSVTAHKQRLQHQTTTSTVSRLPAPNLGTEPEDRLSSVWPPIVHLEFFLDPSSLDPVHFDFLPKSLEILRHFRFPSNPLAFAHLLPPRIKEMQLVYVPEGMIVASISAPLPEGLRILDCRLMLLKPKEHFLHLPHRLTTFHAELTAVSSAAEMALLPRSITDLLLANTTYDALPQLPPALTRLSLTQVIGSKSSSFRELPAGLKILELFSRISPFALASLPPLQYLSLQDPDVRVLKYIPIHVKELASFTMNATAQEVRDLLPTLAPKWANWLTCYASEMLELELTPQGVAKENPKREENCVVQ